MPEQLIDFHGHCGLQHNTCYAPEVISNYLAGIPAVERILISSLSSVVSAAYGERDLLALKDDPKIVPLYWVNPYLEEWSDDLARLDERLPIRGIKLHPTANIYEARAEFLRPVFEHCRRHGRFICVHTDTHGSSPEKLTELILDYPDVDVVLIHMDNPINSIFLAKRCDNVYLETSWIERKWENLAPIKIALDSVAPHKIFFGTDFPYEFPLPGHEAQVGRPRSYEAIAEYYRELLPPEVAQQILHDNARAFLARHGIGA
jgi:predicted TIM-barrel fold metal-dependent hydrolase